MVPRTAAWMWLAVVDDVVVDRGDVGEDGAVVGVADWGVDAVVNASVTVVILVLMVGVCSQPTSIRPQTAATTPANLRHRSTDAPAT
jgi:hypothetical protein